MALVGTYENRFPRATGDVAGETHVITITDADAVFVDTFTIASPGVLSDDEVLGFITAKSISFNMVIDAAILTFLNAIVDDNSARFVVKHEIDSVAVFNGIIDVEQVTTSIRNGTRGFVRIVAKDGIDSLDDFKFQQADKTPYLGRATVAAIIGICMAKIPESGNGQVIHLVSDLGHDLDATHDFWQTTQLDQAIFSTTHEHGGVDFISMMQVLTIICEMFDMTCVHEDNVYVFTTGTANLTEVLKYEYTIAGVFVQSSAFTNPSLTVDNTNVWKVEPDIRLYSAAVGRAIVTFFPGPLQNYLADLGWNTAANDVTESVAPTQTIPVQDANTIIRWRGRIQFEPQTVTTPETALYQLVFFFQIKIGTGGSAEYFTRDRADAGVPYWNNNDYNEAAWGTTAGFFVIPYQHEINLPALYDKIVHFAFYITTTPINQALDNEPISVIFGHNLYNEAGSLVTSSKVEHWLDGSDLIVTNAEPNLVKAQEIVTTLEASTTNPRIIERTLLASTRPGEPIESRITDASTPPVDVTTFTNTLGTFGLEELICRNILSRNMTGNKFLAGDIIGGPGLKAHKAIVYDSITWQAIEQSWIPGANLLNGAWREYNIGDPSALTATVETIYGPISETESNAAGSNPTIIYDQAKPRAYILTATGATHVLNGAPNTDGWSLTHIQAHFHVYHQGVGALEAVSTVTAPIHFSWTNATKTLTLGEPLRSGDVVIVIVWP